jgi:hypothetical protein
MKIGVVKATLYLRVYNIWNFDFVPFTFFYIIWEEAGTGHVHNSLSSYAVFHKIDTVKAAINVKA